MLYTYYVHIYICSFICIAILCIAIPSFVYTGSDRPAIRYLHRHVVIPIAPKWYDVGLELMDINDEKELDVIKAESSLEDTERTKRMLKRWLDKKHNASWNDLIKVFKIRSIGFQALAYEIEGKLLFKSNEIISFHL